PANPITPLCEHSLEYLKAKVMSAMKKSGSATFTRRLFHVVPYDSLRCSISLTLSSKAQHTRLSRRCLGTRPQRFLMKISIALPNWFRRRGKENVDDFPAERCHSDNLYPVCSIAKRVSASRRIGSCPSLRAQCGDTFCGGGSWNQSTDAFVELRI